MTQVRRGTFRCNACDRAYTWRSEIAGRKVRCTCGAFLMAPADPPDPDDDLYALADAEAVIKPGQTVPTKVGEGAVARPQPAQVRPLAYREESTTAGADSQVSAYFPDRVRDLYLPLGLLAFGTIVEIVATWVFSGPRAFSITALMRDLCINLIVSTALMLVAILVAGKLRHIDFGKLPVAVLKLSAVVVGTIGISLTLGVFLTLIPFFGYVMAVMLPFIAFYTLLGALFDLDQSDTGYTTIVMIVVWIVYAFAIKPIFV